MSNLTESPKRHRLLAYVALSVVFPLALWITVQQLQASTSAAAASPAEVDQGIIAYVRRSTHDIHLILPDGTGGRVLWTAPRPLAQQAPLDLAWRPDGRELAFSSEHEETCSWYQSDVYVIGADGTGYRRVTNAPARAVLAGLPKGSVAVNVTNFTSSLVQVYVQGAPGIKSVLNDGAVTFSDVADFGPGVRQPAVGIYGSLRILAAPPLADVQPGATVAGGNLVIAPFSGIDALGAGKVSWTADGLALAYGMRTHSRILRIPASPPYCSIGEALPVVEHAAPNLVAWGPAAVTRDQYLYSSKDAPTVEGIEGIYLNSVGEASGGRKLVSISAYYNAEVVYDVEWLPDGSGFLFTKGYVQLEIYSDIFEYNFTTRKITKLTSLGDSSARGLGISPNGKHIIFERVADVSDPTSSLWIMNRNGSGLRKLADDAGRPAWGRLPAP
jgi:TolB protein